MNSCKSFWLTLVALLLAPHAIAATFTANSGIDAPDNNPGDGLCRSDLLPPSVCTLRAAIMEANALPGSHIINLQSGRIYTLTRAGSDNTALNGDLDITKSLIIRCLGCPERAVVNANGLARAFDIRGGDVSLVEFDITGGAVSGDSGGAIAVRASAGKVALTRLRVYANATSASGGALSNDGPDTTVSASEIHDNQVIGPGTGSGLVNRGVLYLRGSVVHSNFATLSSAQAVWTGKQPGVLARLIVDNSTISGNLGTGLGIFNSDLTRILNSTIAGQTARGITVASSGDGTDPELVIRNSIIAHNLTGDCAVTAINPTFTSSDNLYGDMNCAGIAGVSDVQGVDPLLTPLKRRNGGVTNVPLHWPRQDSPALSAGSTLPVEPGPGCLAVDQVGINRPQGYNGTLRCDIGAAEVPDDAIFFDSLETL